MRFFEHDIENIRIKQRRYSEDEASCQVEDVVATEVADEEVTVKVTGRIVDWGQETVEVEMIVVVITEIKMMKKERRYLNLTLQENNTLTHVIQSRNKQLSRCRKVLRINTQW